MIYSIWCCTWRRENFLPMYLSPWGMEHNGQPPAPGPSPSRVDGQGSADRARGGPSPFGRHDHKLGRSSHPEGFPSRSSSTPSSPTLPSTNPLRIIYSINSIYFSNVTFLPRSIYFQKLDFWVVRMSGARVKN